jgi:putative transposase
LAQNKFNFSTKAFVILPEHIHLVWQMNEFESDYSTPIRMIKTKFSQAWLLMKLPLEKAPSGKVNLWQNRFLEHRIRNE